MTIKVGDKMPQGTFKVMGAEGPKDVTSDELFNGTNVVLFSVPGAFTPTCSKQHLPSYVNNFDKIKAQGVDTVACTAVNDVFVMDAWGKDQKAGDKVTMLADGDGDYAKKLGLELDLRGKGLGVRGKRWSMVVNNGTVEKLNVDEGKYEMTGAEATCSLN